MEYETNKHTKIQQRCVCKIPDSRRTAVLMGISKNSSTA